MLLSSFFSFFFGYQIKHKCVHQKWIWEFINTFRCQTEWTKRNTLILTPNINSQGRLIRNATNENMRCRTIQKSAFLLQWNFTQSLLRHQSTKSTLILFSCYEHQPFCDVNNNIFWIRTYVKRFLEQRPDHYCLSRFLSVNAKKPVNSEDKHQYH